MMRSATGRTFVTNAIIIILGLLNSILLSRWMGATGRGELAAAMLWPVLLIYILNLGLQPTIVYFAAQPGADHSLLFTNSLWLTAAQSLVALPLGYLLMP